MRVFGALVAVSFILLSSSALAGLPDPNNCILPPGITLVGHSAGTPDPLGEFVVVVRDVAGVPMAHSTVEVFLGDCRAHGFRMCATNPGPLGNQMVDCAGYRVVAIADQVGVARMSIIGGADASMTIRCPSARGSCARIRADGVILGQVPVAAYDLNGTNGMNPVDLSLFLNDFFCTGTVGAFHMRSDYNHSGTINPADLAMFLRAYFAGGSVQSCALYCP